MNNTTYRKTTRTVFAVIAVLHALRLLYGWEAMIGGWSVPMWLSVAAVVVAGWLSWSGLRK